MKFSHNWKTHYLSHVSDAEKPHKCQHCPRAFVTAPQLKRHLKQHNSTAPASSQPSQPMKLEASMMKTEQFAHQFSS